MLGLSSFDRWRVPSTLSQLLFQRVSQHRKRYENKSLEKRAPPGVFPTFRIEVDEELERMGGDLSDKTFLQLSDQYSHTKTFYFFATWSSFFNVISSTFRWNVSSVETIPLTLPVNWLPLNTLFLTSYVREQITVSKCARRRCEAGENTALRFSKLPLRYLILVYI